MLLDFRGNNLGVTLYGKHALVLDCFDSLHMEAPLLAFSSENNAINWEQVQAVISPLPQAG